VQASNKFKLLLNKAGDYHPLHGDRLATHLPMVLSALNFLGASDEKLEAIFHESIQGLEYLSGLERVPAIDEISQYLGDRSKYKNYLKYFTAKIERYGAETVLRQTLPIILPGLAASAFHAVIRLAYAIETNSDKEIAISLAFWCSEFQSFDLNEKATDDSLESSLSRLAHVGINHEFSPGIIVDRMAEIGDLLKQGNHIFQPRQIDFTGIRKLCLNAYYAQNDFTLLHTVTGCHAFSIIMPYIEHREAALRELWKAILVAYLSTGLNYGVEDQISPARDYDFEPIIQNALKSTDAHVIKLVYSCSKEYLKHKDTLYYLLAKRAVYGKDA